MQIYGMRLNYFFRFGEKNNSLIFDLSKSDSETLSEGNITLDEIYDKLVKDPVSYVKTVKGENAVTNLLSIVGMRDGNVDISNGIGKSTILEGICYALYEKIVRKHVYTSKEGNAGVSVATRINNKYHSKMQESFVEIIFEENGTLYRLKRGRKFRKNQKSSTPILEFKSYESDSSVTSRSGHTKGRTEEESLNKVITMDYDIFVNGLMFGQGDAGKYLFGTDKIKKDMLINILNLDGLVIDGLEAVRKEKNRVDKEISVLDAQIQAYKDKLQQAKSPKTIKIAMGICEDSIEQLDKDITKFDKEIEIELSSAVIKDIEEIKKKIEDQKKQMDSAEDNWHTKTSTVQVVLDKINQEGRELSKDRIPKLERMRDRLSEESKVAQKLIDEFDKTECENRLKKITKSIDAKPIYEQKLQDTRQKQSKIQENVGMAKAEKNRIELELKKFNVHLDAGEDFECSYCKTAVSIDHVKDHMVRFSQDLEKAEKTCQDNVKAAELITKEADDYETKLSKINDLIAEKPVVLNKQEKYKENLNTIATSKEDKEIIEKDLKYANDKVVELKREQAVHLAQIKEFEVEFKESVKDVGVIIEEETKKLSDKSAQSASVLEKVEELKNNKSVAVDNLANRKEELGGLINAFHNLKTDYTSYRALQTEIETKRKELSRWLILEDVHGLDGIQTRIIRKYLPLLNSYIKGYLDILTDGDMTIDMTINDKSKINMIITGGSSDTFDMLSGGEKMLVRLAVDISLALLSFVRSAQQPELICLDEIFGQLDDKNTGAVFKLLNALSTKFSRVLLISHKPYINDKIDNKIYINKQSGTFGMSEITKIDV